MKEKTNRKALNSYLQKMGERIAKLRKERGLTQADLAYWCQMDTSTISKAERGMIDLKTSSLFALCEVFGIDFASLMDFPGAKEMRREIFKHQPKVLNSTLSAI